VEGAAVAIYSMFTRGDDPEPLAVGDRFSWLAALLPPLHALVHGLWWGLLLWVAGVAALYGLSYVIGGDAAVWLYVLFTLFYGFEANSLRRVALMSRRFAYRGERVASHEDIAAVDWLIARK
jgi:hypothetical protein